MVEWRPVLSEVLLKSLVSQERPRPFDPRPVPALEPFAPDGEDDPVESFFRVAAACSASTIGASSPDSRPDATISWAIEPIRP